MRCLTKFNASHKPEALAKISVVLRWRFRLVNGYSPISSTTRNVVYGLALR